MGVLNTCKPRKEVLKSDLEDAIFAADFGHLIEGKAPHVYNDPATFFQNTHPAKELCKIVQAVFGRLAETREGGATLRLSTGFGGGKTHTLMALWHLARNIESHAMGAELLPAAGRPKNVSVIAVDAGKAGVPEFIAHEKIKVHSLWGEIFYQLGGEKALKELGRADDPEASPSESQIEMAFPKGPMLILLDELVIYMAKLTEQGQGNVLGFLNSFCSAVHRRPQTVFIVTDPGAQAAYAAQSTSLAKEMERQRAAARSLNEVLDRRVSDFDPIGRESAQVITRRLFESIDAVAAQSASATYHNLYKRVLEESPSSLPTHTDSSDYSAEIVRCYPFHPRLMLTATDRLGALGDFQKSRGVLRLFARIIREIWESKTDLELITAGDINWSSQRIQADLLDRLNKPEFKAAISADIEKHAMELDGGKRGLHVRTASAILLESIPLQSNSGLEPADVTLTVLRPEEAGPEPAEAMERLMGVCWHTYPTPNGRGCQFRFEPNIHKQIEERMAQISIEDARSRVLSEAHEYFKGMYFHLCAWPTSANQVPDKVDLQLALCEDEKIACSVIAYSDDSEPASPMPRLYKNAIVAVAPTPSSLNDAIQRARRMNAAENIGKEHRTGDAGKIVREQLKRVQPELTHQFQIQARRAFDRVVLPGCSPKHLDERFQVPDDQILSSPKGQHCLMEFLKANDMIYEQNQALDIDRFLKDVLPGTTPRPDAPDVFSAKAVHERFLSAPNLRLIPDSSIVRQTLMTALLSGKIVIRLSDGRTYDAKGCVQGQEGRRRRTPDTLTTISLDDATSIARSDSDSAHAWLKEDAPQPVGKEEIKPIMPPPPPARVYPQSWEEILSYSENRPLSELHLIASTPGDAQTLINLAQPLGADQITLTVTVRGSLREGGSMNFAARDVKPHHPAKPLQIAQTIFNSIGEDAMFEADLKMTFGPSGRTGMKDLLQQAWDNAPDKLIVKATFDKPTGGKA